MEFNKKNVRAILLIIAFAISFWWCLGHPELFRALLGKLTDVFTPFFIGLALAFVVNLLLRPLETLWGKLPRRGKAAKPLAALKRPVCLFFSFVLLLGIIVLVFLIILPQLGKTLASIAAMLPAYVERAKDWWNGLDLSFGRFRIQLPELKFSGEKFVEQLPTLWENVGKNLFDKTVGVTSSVLSAAAKLLFGLIFAIYVLAQKETLARQLRRLLFALLPDERAGRFFRFTARAARTFSSFVTGQVLEALILGSLCFVGMLILRLPYAGLISVLISVTALIPIFGAWIGAGVGALLILSVKPIQALWFLIFLLTLQQVEGNLIYPSVVGKSVGLPGIWVFASVTVAASAFGIVGLLICVPVCALGYELLREWVERREQKAAQSAETAE